MARVIVGIVFLCVGAGLLAGRRRLVAHQVERIGRPFAPRATVAIAVLFVLAGLLWIDQA